MRRGKARVVALLAGVSMLVAVPTRAATPSSPPAPFNVTVASQPMYGINPTTHKTTLTADDGTELFLETWLPQPKDGNVPPEKIPTILVITPYTAPNEIESTATLNAMVPRGYAYSQLHVRGTGASGGCIDLYGPTEASDGALAIEWVATMSPWGNGVVGGYGVSYPGGTILNAAGRGDPAQTKYLKAVVAGAPALGLYESAWSFDGVPSFLMPQLYIGQYMTTTSLPPGENGRLINYVEKPQCYPAHVQAAADLSGNFTPYYEAREGRDYVANIQAAVFTFHGFADTVPYHGVPPIMQLGLFDRLPATTPKFGVFGWFGHENPSANNYGVRPDIRRGDFLDMEIAWFDFYLKNLGPSPDLWGVAQVQDSDGRWRLVEDWPRATGGPVKTMRLGPQRLGVTSIAAVGASTYLEAGFETTKGFAPGTSVAFDTGPLLAPLEISGSPQLDLWLQLSQPDSHIATRLDAFDATGAPIPFGSTYALRSAMHRDSFIDGRFEQAQGSAAPVNTPFPLTLRFQPTDIVVPAGGHLRLTIAGSLIVNPGFNQIGVPEPLFDGPSQPSGTVGQVSVLHDALHPSALRFDTVPAGATYITPRPR
jgi:predicted acyl esterase